jgi:hypothetical protein
VPFLLSPCFLLAVLVGQTAPESTPQINPVPPVLIAADLPRWEFAQAADGWQPEHQCDVSVAGGLLKVLSKGNDPYLHHAMQVPGGDLVLRLRARCIAAGGAEIFWTSNAAPDRSPERSRRIEIIHDGRWHEYEARFEVKGMLTDLRLDPAAGPGLVEIDWIEILRPHPLLVDRVDLRDGSVQFEVGNHGPAPVEFTSAGQQHSLSPGKGLTLVRPVAGKRPLEAVTLEVQPRGLPPLRRTVFVHRPDAQTEWVERPMDGSTLQVARDGSVARVLRGGSLVCILGPLVHVDGKLPALRLSGDTWPLRFEGEGVTVSLSAAGREIGVSIAAGQPCEGPVVRGLGVLQSGLFAGLEYLGRGEKSSSTLDIETPEHVRFAPDLDKVTMPLMGLVTDRGSVAMTWSDMSLQPVYATPNFFDGSPDHRMALRGRKIEATICVDGQAVEEQILWAVKRLGLPPIPPAPRTAPQQRELCLKALDGPLKSEKGWGHCLGWPAAPYADVASTLWRLTGEAPKLEGLVPGGAHVRNDAIYFVTGRADQWLAHQKNHVRELIRQQGPDGLYHYDGPLRRGHFENTANGVCALPAYVLLQHAQYTGDQEALAAGLRTLEYMKRFRVPRGAQVWEVPLHTPDILASAYLVWAYVLGYEQTGKREYLAEARRWALSGVPFTYLWAGHPVMLYSTVPVLGATQWRHSWFGLPVQWCGGVYAYALTKLAPHDATLDWNHLARGILVSAQQQQYPDGRSAGLLPDSFVLKSQQRNPADINPCAIMALEMVLDGKLDALAAAAGGGHRIVAPFPVAIRDGKAHVTARKGVAYQVLIDGRRIVDVKSQGDDVVPVE